MLNFYHFPLFAGASLTVQGDGAGTSTGAYTESGHSRKRARTEALAEQQTPSKRRRAEQQLQTPQGSPQPVPRTESPVYSPTSQPDALRFRNEDDLINYVGNHFSLIMPAVMQQFAESIAETDAGKKVVKTMWKATPASVLRQFVSRFVHKHATDHQLMEDVASKVPQSAFVQLVQERAPTNRKFFADVLLALDHDHLAYEEEEKQVYVIDDCKKRKIVGAQIGRLTLATAYGSGGAPDDKFHRRVIHNGKECIFSTVDFGLSKINEIQFTDRKMHANASFKIYDDNIDISNDVKSDCRAVLIVQVTEDLEAGSTIKFLK